MLSAIEDLIQGEHSDCRGVTCCGSILPATYKQVPSLSSSIQEVSKSRSKAWNAGSPEACKSAKETWLLSRAEQLPHNFHRNNSLGPPDG